MLTKKKHRGKRKKKLNEEDDKGVHADTIFLSLSLSPVDISECCFVLCWISAFVREIGTCSRNVIR
jgi:hypothetical protein